MGQIGLSNPKEMSIVEFRMICQKKGISAHTMKQIWMFMRGTSKNNLSQIETILVLHTIKLANTKSLFKIPEKLDADLLELISNYQEKYQPRVDPRTKVLAKETVQKPNQIRPMPVEKKTQKKVQNTIPINPPLQLIDLEKYFPKMNNLLNQQKKTFERENQIHQSIVEMKKKEIQRIKEDVLFFELEKRKIDKSLQEFEHLNQLIRKKLLEDIPSKMERQKKTNKQLLQRQKYEIVKKFTDLQNDQAEKTEEMGRRIKKTQKNLMETLSGILKRQKELSYESSASISEIFKNQNCIPLLKTEEIKNENISDPFETEDQKKNEEVNDPFDMNEDKKEEIIVPVDNEDSSKENHDDPFKSEQKIDMPNIRNSNDQVQVRQFVSDKKSEEDLEEEKEKNNFQKPENEDFDDPFNPPEEVGVAENKKDNWDNEETLDETRQSENQVKTIPVQLVNNAKKIPSNEKTDRVNESSEKSSEPEKMDEILDEKKSVVDLEEETKVSNKLEEKEEAENVPENDDINEEKNENDLGQTLEGSSCGQIGVGGKATGIENEKDEENNFEVVPEEQEQTEKKENEQEEENQAEEDKNDISKEAEKSV